MLDRHIFPFYFVVETSYFLFYYSSSRNQGGCRKARNICWVKVVEQTGNKQLHFVQIVSNVEHQAEHKGKA